MEFNSSANSQEKNNLLALDPGERVKKLAEFPDLKIDNSIQLKLYFRTGTEMVCMADAYRKEDNLESAYYFYMKFITLFVEKIRDHREFKNVNQELYNQNKIKLREAFHIAEDLKKKLLEKYELEHQRYLQEQERRKKEQLLKEKQKEELAVIPRSAPSGNSTEKKIAPASLNLINNISLVPSLPADDILYPSSVSVDVPLNKPQFDRSNKPFSLLSANHSRKDSLRTVLVPAKLIREFLVLSLRNTNSNKETCGILAGKLSQDKLTITHLLIPEQTGTPDSCTTQNEEELFTFQDKFDLITLGWIHTHPTQTAFLSSVDLHTHCSYQLMMPEALAIVCAPRYNNYKCFCLTHSYGLRYIANCPIKNGFHPHPSDPPLFMEAEHIVIDERAVINVVDLRK